MPLDLNSLGPQVARLGELARSRGPREQARLTVALNTLRTHADRWDELAERAGQAAGRSGVPFRAALPLEPLDRRVAAAAPPSTYSVVATDGSQIEPDRHGPVLCHLINVGSALLHYGPAPRAALVSQPSLRFEDRDVFLAVGNREPVLVQDRLLALKRHVAEAARLVEVAAAEAPHGPVVGLQDGTLLLSARGQGSETYVWESLLQEFLGHLARLRELGVPLASYVSRPRSTDVVSALRLALCPELAAGAGTAGGCEACRRGESGEPPCSALIGLLDRQVFEALPLGPGERSAVFESSWATSRDEYGEHAIHFFYLGVGGAGPGGGSGAGAGSGGAGGEDAERAGSAEIARVEVPGWVAGRGAWLGLVQAVVYDQCRRGSGYPRALIEAHEKAVITAADRRVYEALLEQALVDAGLPASASRKEQSKRLRTL